MPIGSNRNANAATTEQNADVLVVFKDFLGQLVGKIGKIDRVGCVRTQVYQVVLGQIEERFEVCLQMKTGMVGGNKNFLHRNKLIFNNHLNKINNFVSILVIYSSMQDFFKPLDAALFAHHNAYALHSLGSTMPRYTADFPDLDGVELAIVGIEEERQTQHNMGVRDAPNKVRQELYQLFRGLWTVNIVDLGNIRLGNTINDTYNALQTVCEELIINGTIPIIIGGSIDLSYGQFLAYDRLGERIELATIDSKINLEFLGDFHDQNYLFKMLSYEPSFINNYVNLSHQGYLCDPEHLDFLYRLNFDTVRLGEIRHNILHAEPHLRLVNSVVFNMAAIRSFEAPNHPSCSSPNGLFAHEACQIMKYAGLADRLTSVGFYNYNPIFDRNRQTAMLLSQMIWHFIDGFCSRVGESPYKNDQKKFIKHIALLKETNYEFVFYKSKLTDRWWIQVPTSKNSDKLEKTVIVPCTYEDYKTIAIDQNVPDKWIKIQQRYSK